MHWTRRGHNNSRLCKSVIKSKPQKSKRKINGPPYITALYTCKHSNFNFQKLFYLDAFKRHAGKKTMESRYSYKNLSGTCGSAVCKKRPQQNQQCLYALCSSPASKIPSTLLMNSPNFAAATEFQFFLEKTTSSTVAAGKAPSAIRPVISSIKDYLSNIFKPGNNLMDSTTTTAVSLLEKPIAVANQTKSILGTTDFSVLSSFLRDSSHMASLELLTAKTTETCCSKETDTIVDLINFFDINNMNSLKIFEAIGLLNQQENPSFVNKEAVPATAEEEEAAEATFEVVTYPGETKSKSQKKRRRNRRSKKKKTTKANANNPVGCKQMDKNLPAAMEKATTTTTKPSTSWTFVEKCHNNKHDWIILPKDNFSFELNKRSFACDKNGMFGTATPFCRQRQLSECTDDDFICFELESDVDETDNFSKNTIVTSGYDSDSDSDGNDNQTDTEDGKKVRLLFFVVVFLQLFFSVHSSLKICF